MLYVIVESLSKERRDSANKLFPEDFDADTVSHKVFEEILEEISSEIEGHMLLGSATIKGLLDSNAQQVEKLKASEHRAIMTADNLVRH